MKLWKMKSATNRIVIESGRVIKNHLILMSAKNSDEEFVIRYQDIILRIIPDEKIVVVDEVKI